MKQKMIMISLVMYLLSACGPEPEPTMSAENVQGTAVAAAWTMVAETQAAIPTATPIPPTLTLMPTVIPTSTVATLVFPTQTVLGIATTVSGKDPCDRLLQSDPDGPDFPLKLVNETKAPVTISIILEKTPFGMCGYRSYQLRAKGSILVRFPQGVMYGFAWINDPKTPTTASGGPWKPNNPDKWSILIRTTTLKFVGP